MLIKNRSRSASLRVLPLMAACAVIAMLIGLEFTTPLFAIDIDDDDDMSPVARKLIESRKARPTSKRPEITPENEDKIEEEDDFSAMPKRPVVREERRTDRIAAKRRAALRDDDDDDDDEDEIRPAAKRPVPNKDLREIRTAAGRSGVYLTEDDDDADDEEIRPQARRPAVARNDDELRPAAKRGVTGFLDHDDDDDDDIEPASAAVTEAVPQDLNNRFGSLNRISHLAFPTFGRNDSITPLEAMPYLLIDENFLFSDVRGFITNSSQLGGSVGLGYRRLNESLNAWGGASIWYDADHSSGNLFQQVGLSFEGLIQQWEFRSNVYLPFTSSQTLSSTAGNSYIAGNQLLYDRTVNVNNALRGVDFEAGYSLPIMDRHVVRGFVGGYHFEGGSATANGFKARLEAVYDNMITAHVLYTNDKLYGSNVMAGVSFQFPFGTNHPTSGWAKNTPSPYRFVERNYNVALGKSQDYFANQVATDPLTGLAYNVQQVNSAAAGGTPDGTTNNPYSTVAAAQSAGGNIILVQSGSVLNQAVTLTPGQHLFGQGAYGESVATAGGGFVPIPTTLAGPPGTMPQFKNITGDAVTLASNSEVAGFSFINTSGNGITGNGVSGVSLDNLAFSQIGGDAINLANTSGDISLSTIQVNSATGNGIVFNGGNPNITYLGGGSSITAQGNGFVLQNLTGGVDNLTNLSLSQVGGTGLLLSNVAADVNVNTLTVSQTGSASSPAVSISGTTNNNTYNFNGSTNVTLPGGAGFSVNGTNANVNVGSLNVMTSSGQPAVSVVNASNPVKIGSLSIAAQNNSAGLVASGAANLTVQGGSISTIGGAAVDVQASGFNASLASVSANGGAYGIRLLSSTGSFSIIGGGNYATGGTIQNMTTAGMSLNGFGSTNLKWVDFVNNATGIQSTGSTQLALTSLRISGSTAYAVDSMNDVSLAVSNSYLTNNGTSGTSTVRVEADTVGSYTSIIQANNITNPSGPAIQYLSQAGAAGSTLKVQLTSNIINSYQGGPSSVIGINWTGPTTATINNNTINVFGSDVTAIRLEDPSTTALLNASITGNAFIFEKTATSSATNGTGIWIVDGQSGVAGTGTSTLSLVANAMTFQSTGGTGMRFGLHQTSNSSLSQNIMIDQAGGMTGMLYDYAAANSILSFAANNIGLLAADPLVHRGILFTNIAPKIQLAAQTGSATNVISNAANSQDMFSAPIGTIQGGISINNNMVLPP